MIDKSVGVVRKFGVGCFEFRPQQSVPFTITVKKHAEAITKGLSQLTSLSDLEVFFDEEDVEELDIDQEIPSLAEGTCFPELSFGRIHFSLYIPMRIQKELHPGHWSSTNTEHFAIYVRYSFNGPVVFVECVNAGSDCDPSDGVIVVREYLKQQLAHSDSIIFDCIGPSPFHADFFAQQHPSTKDIDVEQTKRPGYNRFDIKTNWSLEDPDGLDRVFNAFEYELDDFYHLARQRVLQMNRWSTLEEDWSSLRVLVRAGATFYQLGRRLEIHKAARNLVTDAYAFSADRSMAKQSANETVNETHRNGLPPLMANFVEASLSEAFPEYPVDSLIAWATHIHDSSFKTAELGTVFLSALVGGLVGSILTALFTAGSPPQHADNSAVASPNQSTGSPR